MTDGIALMLTDKLMDQGITSTTEVSDPSRLRTKGQLVFEGLAKVNNIHMCATILNLEITLDNLKACPIQSASVS